MENLTEVFRVNATNNSTNSTGIAIASRVDEVSFRVKFSNGHSDTMLEEDLTFFSKAGAFNKSYSISIKPWMLN